MKSVEPLYKQKEIRRNLVPGGLLRDYLVYLATPDEKTVLLRQGADCNVGPGASGERGVLPCPALFYLALGAPNEYKGKEILRRGALAQHR